MSGGLYRVIELQVNNRVLPLFAFLKNNPTRTLRKGNHVLMAYFEPLGASFSPFSFKGITVTPQETDRLESLLSDGWELVRDYAINTAGAELLEVLEEIEQERLQQRRTGSGLVITGAVYDWIAYGIKDKASVKQFVKCFYLSGYSYEETTQVFTNLVKPDKELVRTFLTTINSIYRIKEDGDSERLSRPA